ncbi:hypothetical protein [Nocardioides bizhenqiangii]|uniref:Glycosyltransferase RgtA/B/C/D-like domain-containing protein n=1 Tax=Nocardioides bizhenqiangii TaxID=3095076 RepID=A0ABZ0ZMD2_9ACTN|nr:hypothetical protein [Nocardioides sp. HM61]WQQ24944.1 hypothetical protein SHK19_13315 [Nocardioides sp. HM61]
MIKPGRGTVVDLAWSTALALAVFGPLLAGRGYWLVGDMVFVPDQPWKPAWLGLDGALPRAVPMDALVSVATQFVPGSWVQRGLLVGGFLLGGVGIGRVVRAHAWYARAAAITLLLWNPWVYERLLIGQWAILLGYLALPWVVLAARRLRDEPRNGWAEAAIAVTVSAVCSPSSGVMAVAVLAVLGTTRDRRTWMATAAVGVVGNLTWVVPALTAAATDVSTQGVFAAFAARGESGAGLLPSLVSLGGIWKTSILPEARTSAALVVLSCLLTVAAAAGLRRAVRKHPGEWPRLAGLGLAALAVAAAPAVPGGAEALEDLAARLPGLALLRDSHRFLAPLGVVLAVGAAGAATAVRERVRPGRGALWSVVGLIVAAPVLLLPGLAWGAAGELERSSYPAEWEEVAALLGDAPGRVVVLPWEGAYRGYDWNHRRAVLDPAPRYFPGEVLVDDRVLLDDGAVPAEDPRVEEVRRALDAADPAAALESLGVRWVLVEKGRPGIDVPEGDLAYDGDELSLVELSSSGSAPGGIYGDNSSGTIVLIVTGHTASMVLLLVGAFRHNAGHATCSPGRKVFGRGPFA